MHTLMGLDRIEPFPGMSSPRHLHVLYMDTYIYTRSRLMALVMDAFADTQNASLQAVMQHAF